MVFSNKYEILSQLGQGGMGLVYKVRHIRLETISALKVLPANLMEDKDMVARFYREARVMAQLNHRNIVRVVDIDHDADLNLYYFVMDYIEGVTLGKYLREKGPLPLLEIFDFSRQVAEALSYAHHHTPPVIHRDIKPANIMIEAASSRVVVMDFGIAKEIGQVDSTKTGVFIGTVKYASPEQLRHESLTGSADVYSLGMVMYEMYTGKQFFHDLDEHTVLHKILYDSNDNESIFGHPPSPAFAALITKAIRKDRNARYGNMLELIEALDHCRETERRHASTPQKSTESGENTNPTVDAGIVERKAAEREEDQKTVQVPPRNTPQEDRKYDTPAGFGQLNIEATPHLIQKTTLPKLNKVKVGMLILLLSTVTGIGMWHIRSDNEETQPSTPDSGCLSAAWNAYNGEKYDDAIAEANKCISLLQGTADRLQEELRKDKIPLPPVGRVSEAEKLTILNRGPLNDVATSFFIIGEAEKKQGHKEKARAAYNKAAAYTYGRTWDPNGWFWDPSKHATSRLTALK